MRYKKMFISTAILTILATTGCVRPTTNQPTVNRTAEPPPTASTVYDNQPSREIVYEDTTPVIYSDSSTVNGGSNVYSTGGESSTVVETYEPTTVTTTNTTPTTTTTNRRNPFDDPYADVGTGRGDSGSDAYIDPYSTTPPPSSGSYSSAVDTYTDNSSYNVNTPSSYSSGNSNGGAINLQVAALRDYYAAEEYKTGLSLPPQYSAYIKRGAINKVIITGFSSRAEARALADRQFPGAFIVYGTPSPTTQTSSYGGGSVPSYTPPKRGGDISSGIGIQIGAFSSKSAAKSAVNNYAGSRYTPVVKTVTSRGKTLYKAILLGFSNIQEARRAIATGRFGDAFLVTNIYP